MDSRNVIFCLRDDEIKDIVVYDSPKNMGSVAAVPCSKKRFGRNFNLSQNKVKQKLITLYENTGAEYLWLDEALCEFLNMEKMDFPESLWRSWLLEIPSFHTLIFADDLKANALNFIEEKSHHLAAVCVVCYEQYFMDYEFFARNLFESEGLVLQIFTYEEIEKQNDLFIKEVYLKGRAALLDFDGKSVFWEKRLQNEIGYYSFRREMGLFLDTFRKKRYNTLIK